MDIKLQCRIRKLDLHPGDVVTVGDEVGEELATRLLKDGVAITIEQADEELAAQAEAERIAEEEAAKAAEVQAKFAKAKSAEKVAAQKARNYDNMTRAELVKVAKELGVSHKKGAYKATILAAIKEHVGQE